MTNFELFTLMYFSLGSALEEHKDDKNLLQYTTELNPFVWDSESSADPSYYEKFCRFMDDRTIGDDYGYSLALEFIRQEEFYKNMDKYFLMTSQDEYIKAAKEYLKDPHKGDGRKR